VHRGCGSARRRQQNGGIVNLKGFFVATLQSALDLGIAVPDDVLRHVTPDVLAANLPRPLWARLLTACVGAARVDAQLVVETIGVPNLCEHVPAQIIWGCIEEIGLRSLAGGVAMATSGSSSLARSPSAASAASSSRPIPLATPPPPEPRASTAPPATVGPSIPAPVTASTDVEVDSVRSGRLPPGGRFRPSSTGIGRLAANNSARRPQVQATPPSPPADTLSRAKRTQTDADFEPETYVGNKDDWKNALAVEDEQLVDWAASDETVSGGGDELSRKR